MNNSTTLRAADAAESSSMHQALTGFAFQHCKKYLYPVLLVFQMMMCSPLLAQDGRFPIVFKNLSGLYSDDEVYIYGLALNAENQWCYIKPTGQMVPMNPADINGPGHLTKKGMNFANYAFKLSQAGNLMMENHVRGGRFYISVGEPVYIRVAPEGVGLGWGGPNLNDPDDPNADVIWDMYEFTYVQNQVPFGGNISSVDQFGFTMTARLEQTAIGYDKTVGSTMSRDEVFRTYYDAVPAAFKALANKYRIVAPRSSALFKTGGAYASYLQSYIDQVWSYYTNYQFKLTRLNQTFTGQVSGGVLVFTGPTGSGSLRKPTTTDVCECSGSLASFGMNDAELQMGAEFCAAFNRGVAMNTSQWWGQSLDYYKSDLQNDYSKFMHDISIDKRSYAFAYDDINDQSSVEILPNANPPGRLTITIQKFGNEVDSISDETTISSQNTLSNQENAEETATEQEQPGVCAGTVENGDYRYEVSTSSGTVSWKFIPLAPTAGSTLAIITVKTSTGGYIGYMMTPSGNDFTFSQAYPTGTALTFYFTYRIGNTYMERNSSLTPHTYNVGTTCAGARIASGIDDLFSPGATGMVEDTGGIFPNPACAVLHVPAMRGQPCTVSIQDALGKSEIAVKDVASNGTIDVSTLLPGCYSLIYVKDGRKVMKRFLKE